MTANWHETDTGSFNKKSQEIERKKRNKKVGATKSTKLKRYLILCECDQDIETKFYIFRVNKIIYF